MLALLATLGLWLPVRLLWGAWRSPWRCTICTNRVEPLGKSLKKAAGYGFGACLSAWLACAYVFHLGEKQQAEIQRLAQEEARVQRIAKDERRAARAEAAAEHRLRLEEELARRRPEIVASIQGKLRAGDPSSAAKEATRFTPVGDSEISELHAEAQRRIRESALVAKAAELPASDFAGNEKVYAELVNLAPDNSQHRAKLAYYSAQIADEKRREEAEQAEREERIARYGEPPTPSAWDGSYLPVKQHLKRVANDPDSIKVEGCTKVYLADDGWLVGCDYRGRNGFGGVIRTANWFTIRHGQVVAMHDSDAYRK